MNIEKSSITPAQAPLSTSHWLTAKEAAAYLRIDPRTLLSWARQGKVNAYKLSGTQRHVWRFLVVDLDAMMQTPSVAVNRRIQ